MSWLSIAFIVIITSQCPGQKVINFEVPVNGEIHLTEEISIPKINSGYTVWLPKEGPIKGLVVFIHPRRDTVKSETIIDYSLQNHLAVLYATTNNRLEFFFEKEKIAEVEKYIYQLVTSYNIPKNNLLFCGMSIIGQSFVHSRTISTGMVKSIIIYD